MTPRVPLSSGSSQYPYEREVLFAPLTGIEMRGSRIEGSVVVAEMVLSVNLMSPTIEQVASKMKLLATGY